MDTRTIRKVFIDYFKKHEHLEAISSSLVPDEPTLLLTNSGMVQMMPYLLAQKNPPHIRMCSVQKSFRTGDIDDVGLDGRHFTFFEMLGSWSFGDYYKKDAIQLALDLLVHEYHFVKEHIWVTIFKGEDPIPKDTDSYTYWIEQGIPKERIVELGWKDNFWGPPGETGPCGPSTEIYYDMGEDVGCKKPDCKPGCDCDRFLEIWNAGVFMEYYKDEFGKFSPLPQKNVDTGAGLERLAAFLQHKKDAYDTDLIRQIIDLICEKLHITHYDTNKKAKRSIKIITDHIRASIFLIADGVTPSNEHRGYILRKVLRRALSQVKIHKGPTPFFTDIIDLVISLYTDQYPELTKRKEVIHSVIRTEEEKFSKTLATGIRILEKLQKITGEDIFKLQDTYGLPPEIALDLLEGLNITYDKEEITEAYKISMEKQRSTSRIGSMFTLGKVFEEKLKKYPATNFVGYTELKLKTEAIAIERTDAAYFIILKETPLYAESGGQTGDSGTITFPTGMVTITNVKKTKRGVFIHIAKRSEENDAIISIPTDNTAIPVTVEVDEVKRKRTSYNHTATHLLHAAIRKILGSDSHQKGSYLDADRFRFDFTYGGNITKAQIQEIEQIVNAEIKKDIPVQISETSYHNAKKSGAIGLFENTYGEKVRTVKINTFSYEMCGGTHAVRTGDLGTFRILKLESVSEGVKRIRAILE